MHYVLKSLSHGLQRSLIGLLCSILPMMILLMSAHAQSTNGSIYGTVADITGGVIPNATLTIRNTETGETHTAQSNSSGNFIFPTVNPGEYIVSVRAASFESMTQTGLRVDVAQNVNASFSLKPGSVDQTIIVTAATPMVDTRESQLGETVDEKRIEDLPLNGRDAYDLVQTVAGVTNYSPAATGGDQNGTEFNVNGNRANADSFYLDGAFDMVVYRNGGNVIPNPDALQEFRLLTSNFDAEFGREPGGVVNTITRSGTNHFHGSAWEYLRNDAFDATTFDTTGGVTPLKQNQFGGAFGGPIHHDKLFFFGSYEGLIVHTPVTITSGAVVLPTPAELAGNFTALPTKSQPSTTCNGKKGMICPSAFDPVALNILKSVPIATATGVSPQQQAPANISANQYLGRVDYQMSQAHKLSGTFFTSRTTTLDPTAGSNQILDYSGVSDYENQVNAIASDQWIISPNALNSAHFFYTLNHYVIQDLYNNNTWADLGSQIQQGAYPATQPQISITGYWDMGVGGSGPDNLAQQSFGFFDTFNYIHGNHTVKAGGSFIWTKYDETGQFLGTGKLGFTGSSTGNALADFLLGEANTLAQNSGVYHRLHAPDPAVFAQDDWRVTHKLTLNIGLRWELYQPFTGQNNLGTFVPYVESKRFPSAPLGLLSSGDPGVPDGIRATDWTTFAPRVGFAYDVFGNGATALRGAYGIFYSDDEETLTGNLEQQPFLLSTSINVTPNLVNPYAPGPDPYPYNIATPTFSADATLAGLAPGATVPYVQEYNLTLQQQFGSEWSMQLAYVGSVSRRFYLLRDENSPVYEPNGTVTTAGLNARRPYEPTPNSYIFSTIGEIDDAANAAYNSLQAVIQHRMAHNFSFSASYVWARNIDIASSDPSNATSLALVDENDLTMDRGVSSTDIQNRFVSSYLWLSPTIHHFGLVGREVLSGWQVNGITTLASGSPFTVTSGKDTNLDGVATDRPNQIGIPDLPKGRSKAAQAAEYFNTDAYAQLPTGVPYGNVGRDSLFGPGTINTDLSIFKDFAVVGRQILQFRGEAFNVFNHTNLNNPNAVLTSAKFGTIAGAAAPRILQLALRYSF